MFKEKLRKPIQRHKGTRVSARPSTLLHAGYSRGDDRNSFRYFGKHDRFHVKVYGKNMYVHVDRAYKTDDRMIHKTETHVGRCKAEARRLKKIAKQYD